MKKMDNRDKNKVEYHIASSPPPLLCYIAILVGRVGRALQVLFVYQSLYTLLDHGDARREPGSGLADDLQGEEEWGCDNWLSSRSTTKPFIVACFLF